MIEVDETLWEGYRKGSREAYEALTEAYLPLVKITVGRMAMNLPSFVDYEELYSTGCMGLIAAIKGYDPSREAQFTTYAITRIRGAVIDELRQHDLLGRVTRDRVTRIREVEDSFRAEGINPTAEEVAQAAGLTLNTYRDAMVGERASRMISLSEPVSLGDTDQPLADLLAKQGVTSGRLSLEDREILDLVGGMLSERERVLVVLYYQEELTLKEIGALMGVSESRVSQLHAEMVVRIQKNLKKIGI
ncbi:MAG: FliA/WhiG family RNA polymerase sigma factor [Planctomycetota bacterium]